MLLLITFKYFIFYRPATTSSRQNESNEEIEDEAFETTTETTAINFEIEEVMVKEDSLSDVCDTSRLSICFDDSLPPTIMVDHDDKSVLATTFPIDRPVSTTSLFSAVQQSTVGSAAKKRKVKNEEPTVEDVRPASPKVKKIVSTVKSKNDSIKDAMLEAINVFKEHCVQKAQQNRVELDENDYFGLGMVKMIKKMPLAARNMAKVKIHTYLSNLELGYDDENLD